MNIEPTKNNICNLFFVETPKGLNEKIIDRVTAARIHEVKRNMTMYISGTFVSIGFFVIALRYTMEQFTQSAFPRYLSLVGSDFSALSTYWKDLTYAFAESIPLVSITLLLITAAAVLFALQKTLQNVSIVRGSKLAINH